MKDKSNGSSAALVLALALAAWGCQERPSPAGAPAPAIAAEVVIVDPPANPGSLAPELAGGDDLWLTWLEPTTEPPGHALRIARRRGESWSEPRTAAAGGRFFANWADRPAAAAAADGTLLVHWLEKLGDGTYDYGVELARSSDGGLTWEPLGLLHDDDTPAEHGFVSYVAGEDGVDAFWLDGRAMPAGGAMQLRTARLEAAAAYRPAASTVLDEAVCECCATDAALTGAGPVVVYRDRSAGEVRDVAVVRRDGEGWSAPRLVASDGWKIHGCPVNGPAVAARGESVAVAWFTGADLTARVRVAFSDDAGATFGPPVEVDGDGPVGRVDVVLDDAGSALVSWLGVRGNAGEIRWRRVSPSGAAGAPQTLVTTTTQRSAGVPRLARHRGRAVLAWVDDGEPGRVRAAQLSLTKKSRRD
jgi:hypothetical protein